MKRVRDMSPGELLDHRVDQHAMARVTLTQLGTIKQRVGLGWCQLALAVNKAGYRVPPTSGAAIEWCLDGAVQVATGATNSFERRGSIFTGPGRILNDVAKQRGFSSYISFNDGATREKEEVLGLIDEAIEVARRRERLAFNAYIKAAQEFAAYKVANDWAVAETAPGD